MNDANPTGVQPGPPARLHHRFAVATVLAAVPLLLFGGSVTSLEAGMAIDGWWILEPGRGDHFLLFYPIEKWFRDPGTFVEHTHRLFGTLVGLLSILTVVTTFRLDPRRGARVIASAGLLAVIAQGTLGGFRVLENSPELAFLHGAFAQLVVALLAGCAVVLSPRWRTVERVASGGASGARADSPAPHGHGILTAVFAYAAIFAGAWLRHAASNLALAVHAIFAVGAAMLVFGFASRLRARAEAASEESAAGVLRLQSKRLHQLVGLQILLGVASYLVVFVVVGPTVREVHQSIVPTLHVLVGAMLIAQTVAAVLWTHRIVEKDARANAAPLDVPRTEASR